MSKSIDLIPGPVGDEHGAFVGECGGFKSFFERCHAEYGDVFRFVLGKRVIVSVRNGELISKCRPLVSCGDRPEELFEFVGHIFGEDNLQIYDAERARNARKILSPALALGRLRRFFPELVSLVENLTQDWSRKSGPIMCQKQLRHFAMASSSLITLGSGELGTFDVNAFANAYEDAITGALSMQMNGSLDKKASQSFYDSVCFMHSSVDSIISSNREATLHEDDFLGLIMRNFETDVGSMLLKVYTVAGYHTTISSLAWTIFYITQNDQVQDRLHKEIDEALPNDDDVLTHQNIRMLPFFHQVVKEAMRLQPSGSFAARKLTEDTTLDDYLLPKGTAVFVPISAIQVHEEHWKNPTQFNPDRFGRDDQDRSQSRNWYMPFGFGRRVCPGQAMATTTIVLAIASLLRRHRINLAMDVEKVVAVERFVTWAEHDIAIKMEPRK